MDGGGRFWRRCSMRAIAHKLPMVRFDYSMPAGKVFVSATAIQSATPEETGGLANT